MTIQYHKPKDLPIDELSLDLNKFGENLIKAEYALGVLEGSQKKLQNPTLLIAPLTAKEAAVSSRIEGTQSTVSDVFLYEAGGKPKHPDTAEVINYRKSMNAAISVLRQGRSLSIHMLKSLHQILLTGVRHKGTPGKFRDKAIWIGEKFGDPIEKAIHIPPEAHMVNDYIDNLFAYIEKSKDSPLIKAGVIHYQFEAIHPFEDGNGRIGRLLIPLILYEKQKISSPILYISGYFEKNREAYIDALHRVDEGGNYEDWLNFFFYCVAEQIKETQSIIGSIYGLYDGIRNEIKGSKSPYIFPFIDFLFKSPIFSTKQVKESINCFSRITVRSLIEAFQKKGKVVELTKYKREKLYGFTPLLRILS